jgi:hypothetical protein
VEGVTAMDTSLTITLRISSDRLEASERFKDALVEYAEWLQSITPELKDAPLIIHTPTAT